MVSRPKINEVFTPRLPDVNRSVYVDRPGLEKSLRRAIEGTKHAVVFGESGSGKSWLYKKVLADMCAHVSLANCANALRSDSVTNEIRMACGLTGQLTLTGMSETKKAEVKALVAEGGLSSTRDYDVTAGDPLLEAFAEKKRAAGSKLPVIVLDNLELIIGSKELMEELASIITLLDDERFARYGVKLLIVGVPSVVRDYFKGTPAAQTVSNRLTQVSEVSSLSAEQVDALIEKGFKDLLHVEIAEEDLAIWKRHILRVTMGFAQAVQEYCEQLGYIVEDAAWKGSPNQLRQADAAWMEQGLNRASVVITSRMNERETRVGRRNQVLFALGQVTKRIFSPTDVEQIVRRLFPDSTENTTQLAIGQILSELSSGVDPLIKNTAGGSDYEFRDARYAMALRVLLEKDTERHEKVRRAQSPLP